MMGWFENVFYWISINWLNPLRKLTYRAGFRPGPGTILHSPSMHLFLAYKEATRKAMPMVYLNKSPILTAYVFPDDCTACNGWVLEGKQWVRISQMVGLVCPACGTDYGSQI